MMDEKDSAATEAVKKTTRRKPMPGAKQPGKPLPQSGNALNRIRIGDDEQEIRPTKLKYMRNRTAAFYRILELYPLADVLAMDKGAFDDERDGDQALFDWQVAVADDETFVKAHYDDMDIDIIEELVRIFRRVNRIDEKEDRQKNLAEMRKEAE